MNRLEMFVQVLKIQVKHDMYLAWHHSLGAVISQHTNGIGSYRVILERQRRHEVLSFEGSIRTVKWLPLESDVMLGTCHT